MVQRPVSSTPGRLLHLSGQSKPQEAECPYIARYRSIQGALRLLLPNSIGITEMGQPCHPNAVQLTPMPQYSELQQGQRAAGGQKKCFSDQLKAALRKCSVPPAQLETLAADRVEWREVCDEGLAAFNINYDPDADARRARRHTVTSVPATGPCCHICVRVCASDFGLMSHFRYHCPSLTS